MGKTKIKAIDDSAPQQEAKVSKPKPGKRQEDTLVAKLKEELGIEPETKQASEPETPKQEKKEEKTQKPGKSKPRSKKYLEASKDLDRSKSYPISEALDMVKKMSYAKFNATLDVSINTVQTGLRGLISLPYATAKKLRILAFGKGSDSIGADLVGSDEIIESISKGKIDFDLVITTPEWMPKLTKVAKVLGPKGLMPNPKAGTITDDLKKAVESFQVGKVEFKTESKAPVIHLALGKLNQPNDELEANIKLLLSTLGKTKIKRVTLSPTMGPGVKLDLTSI